MCKIAMIDDKSDERFVFKERIELVLGKLGLNWNIDDYDPLQSINDYPEWIRDNNIDILIIDERLHEQSSVNYNGHDLVKYIRQFYQDMPIFILTAYGQPPELLSTVGDIDLIIQRTIFGDYAEEYVKTIVRISKSFFERHQQELLKLSELAEKIINKSATEKEFEEVKALQEKLQIPFTADILNERSVWIEQFSSKIKKYEELSNSIEKFLKENK